MDEIFEALHLPGTIVVDVRTPAEYANGHYTESINIPLTELENNIEKLRYANRVMVCCASGVRSQKACILLRQKGIESIDGGSWLSIDQHSKK